MIGKKIDTARSTVEKHIDFLRCPLCFESFSQLSYSLKCKNSHTYDISRKGYINLFNGQTKIIKTYDKKLFAARKMISDAGLYDKLREKLSGMISPSAVLDAGCGCGNLTADIFNSINKPVTFAVDLSKDGIDFAAANFCGENLLWIVGNLNNLPISGNKIDVVLNIMSPANYAEFVRVLKPGGILVKVMPDSDYLKELRRFIYKENDKNEYSNKDVLTNLADNMDIMDITALQYAHSVLPEHIPALFDMTPLTSNIGEREAIRDELTKAGAKDFEITLAFKIAVCRSN